MAPGKVGPTIRGREGKDATPLRHDPRRVARRGRDHRGAHRPAHARGAGRAGVVPSDAVHQQPQADRAGRAVARGEPPSLSRRRVSRCHQRPREDRHVPRALRDPELGVAVPDPPLHRAAHDLGEPRRRGRGRRDPGAPLLPHASAAHSHRGGLLGGHERLPRHDRLRGQRRSGLWSEQFKPDRRKPDRPRLWPVWRGNRRRLLRPGLRHPHAGPHQGRTVADAPGG